MKRWARGRGKIASLLLALAMCAAICPGSAWGLEAPDSGVSAALTSDKASYEVGDVAEFSLAISNASDDAVGEASYSLTLPSQMKVVDGDLSAGLGSFAAGEEKVVVVKAKVIQQPTATEGSSTALLPATGDSPLLAGLVAAIALGALAVSLIASRKSRNAALSVVLICGLSGSLLLSSAGEALAEESRQTTESLCDIEVDGVKAVACAVVTFSTAQSAVSADCVTRGQWISDLVAASGLNQIEDVECPYSDIAGHSYEAAIRTAYAHGIIDEGDTFDPDSPASREFAFASAVLACGFCDDGTDLVANDASNASNPALLAIALDVGIATLDEYGNIRPTSSLTKAEAEIALKAVGEIISSYSNEGEERANVIYKDETVVVEEYQVSGEQFVVDSAQYDLSVGDVVAFDSSSDEYDGAIGRVAEVVDAEGSSTVTIDQISDPSEAFEMIDVAAYDVPVDYVELAEGVEYEQGMSRALDLGKLKLKYKSKDGSTSASVSVNPKFDVVKFDWGLFKGLKAVQVELSADTSAEVSHLNAKAADEKIPLFTAYGHIWGPLNARVDVNIHFTIDGKASIEVECSQVLGVKYERGHFSSYSESDAELKAKCQVESTLGVQMPIALLAGVDKFSIQLIDVSGEAGFKGEASTTVRTPQLSCMDGRAYFFLKVSAGEETDWLKKIGFTYSKDLINDKNSALKWSYHMENGQEVPACTWEEPSEPSDPDDSDLSAAPKEDFDYFVGSSNQKQVDSSVPKLYGCQYGRLCDDGAITFSDVRCGYGVYITDYTGNDSNVVVPKQIDGIDVVYVGLSGGSEGECKKYGTIDVSRCDKLKAIYLSCGAQQVNFGQIKEVQNVWAEPAEMIDSMDMSGLSDLRMIFFNGGSPKEFKINTTQLQWIGAMGLSSIDLSNAKRLEVAFLSHSYLTTSSLKMDNCSSLRILNIYNCQLTSLDVSKFPNLVYLDCSYNRISNTSALEAWLAVDGHDGYVTPQDV